MKIKLPLISVIIPVHNAEKYLEECLNSVLCQTYINLEVIVIDDNSTDNSLNILKDFAKKDSRIRWMSQKNGSAALTRNYGLDNSQGDYIFFIDADDAIKKETIARLYKPLENEASGISMSKYTTIKQKFDDKYTVGETEEFGGEFLLKLKAIQKSEYPSFSPWGKLYTRNIFENIRFPDMKIHEDTAVILSIIHKSDKVFLIDSIDWFYRINPKSVTQSEINEKNEAIFIKNDFQINFVKDKHPEALNYIYQLCMNENDYVAMKCVRDGSAYAVQLFEKIYKQNQYFSEQSHSRKFLYKSKMLYKIYLGISVRLWNSDFIRGLAKKILT